MRSRRWEHYRVSNHIHPTYIVKGHGQTKGKLVIGSKTASKEVPKRFLGRNCRTKKIAGNWVFSRRLQN